VLSSLVQLRIYVQQKATGRQLTKNNENEKVTKRLKTQKEVLRYKRRFR